MRTDPAAFGFAVFSKLVAGALGRRRTPPVETDVDFRPLPERRDVIAGWEHPPYVPGSAHDDVR
jgi:hypothetical protein